MFPYRRHGGKKRSKGAARKSRGPQRPLPNSARDLLPLLQPATKALAQMLAGRAGVSGQLNHARNLLAHAERLIGDRVHNRLIPAEREEFFEQLARLRLTLADADAEAEVQAAQEQEERRPAPPPVAQERLKEMALALSRPERDRPGQPRAAGEPDDRGTGQTAAEPAPAASDAASEPPTQSGGSSAAEERPLKPLASLPGRLVLSKTAGEQARSAVIRPALRRGVRASARAAARTEHGDSNPAPPAAEEPTKEEARSADRRAGNNGGGSEPGPEERAKATRRGRKTKDGLPEGWVINEEGYVVPRHG